MTPTRSSSPDRPASSAKSSSGQDGRTRPPSPRKSAAAAAGSKPATARTGSKPATARSPSKTAPPARRRRIGLLGATGYTGRLVAAELAARSLPARLGGRDQQRLAEAPLARGGERATVDVTDPSALAAFMAGLDVVISCVGPFSELGLPVVDAAVAAGVHYVDAAGELGFIRDVYTRYPDAATAVVPACGFDYLPGDLAAALAASALTRPCDEMLVAYRIHWGGVSRGTLRSAAGVLASAAPSGLARLRVPWPEGSRDALELPWGETVTVPRHLPGARVRCAIDAPAPVAAAAPAVSRLAPAALPVVGPLLRKLADYAPEGPSETTRAAARYDILAAARGDGQEAAVRVRGNDIYRLSAVLLVEAAVHVRGSGPLAPAQAFGDPARFLDTVAAAPSTPTTAVPGAPDLPLLTWERVPPETEAGPPG